MRILAASLGMGLALGGAAVAQSESEPTCNPLPPGLYLPPGTKWTKLPSGPDMAATYPREAWREGKPARAVLRCVTTAEGGLTDCLVAEESVTGAGAGAMTLSGKFRFGPSQRLGEAVAGYCVRLPVNWN